MKNKETTIKLEHIATGQEKNIPITDREYLLLTNNRDIDGASEMGFQSMINRGVLDDEWHLDFFFEGVYLGDQLKSH
jgi:hypothetical protein